MRSVNPNSAMRFPLVSMKVLANQAIDLNENGQIDAVPFGQRYWTGYGSIVEEGRYC